jgi:5-methylcytosine-specific restriction endonuclease McrA
MVKIDKSSRYKGKIFDDETEWKTGTDVFRQLLEDTRGKCYICEDNPSALNVDHIKPRSKYPAPEYARGWDNLLPACKPAVSITTAKADSTTVSCDRNMSRRMVKTSIISLSERL